MKVHITQRAKIAKVNGQKTRCVRLTGRMGNVTVTIDVPHGDRFWKRLLSAKGLIYRRLGVPPKDDMRDIWSAVLAPWNIPPVRG